MGEREVVKAIRKHVEELDDNWKFVAGRQVIYKKDFLIKLKKDKKFRKMVATMVINLSIDILTRNTDA